MKKTINEAKKNIKQIQKKFYISKALTKNECLQIHLLTIFLESVIKSKVEY